MSKLLLLFSLILSIPVLPLRPLLEHGKLLGFHPSQRRITHRQQSEKELPPSIYSVDSFKSVWTVSAETINFLHWWAFFIGTKFISSGFRKGHSIITALLGIRDDIRAMKRGEVSLMVFADYSEAFDTVCFKTVPTRMHALGFSYEFLTWMVHYLSDRRQSRSNRRQDLVYRGCTVWCPTGTDTRTFYFQHMFLIVKNTLSVLVTRTLTTQLSSFPQRRRT